MSTQPIDEDAVAAADKEMEERANRAKELLSQRYRGLKKHQVRARQIIARVSNEVVLTHSNRRKTSSCARCNSNDKW